MISAISGLVLTGASSATLWYLLPSGGVLHPLLKKPMMDSTIPILIVSGLSIGIALIVAGIVS
ncbi:MAG: hypothetical protein AB7O50_04330 [Pseudolabrys sp.]